MLLQAGGFSATKVDTDPRNPSGLKSNITAEFQLAVYKVQEVFGEQSGYSWFCNLDNYAGQYTGTNFWADCARGSFMSDRVTFYITHVGTIDLIRGMDSDYGVLPIGKLYDTQKDYGNTVQYYHCAAYSIPSGSDFANEKSTYILEAMAYYSSPNYSADECLKYTYYTRVLKAKGIRDDAAWEMLDLVFENRAFDLVACAKIGGVYSGVRTASLTATGTFAAEQYSNLDALINDKLKVLLGK